MKKQTKILLIAIVLAFGLLSIFHLFDYWQNEELHLLSSAPWYSEVVIYGLFALIASGVVVLLDWTNRKK